MQTFTKVIDRSSAGKCVKINSDRDGFGSKVALGVPIKKTDRFLRSGGVRAPRWVFLTETTRERNRETIPV